MQDYTRTRTHNGERSAEKLVRCTRGREEVLPLVKRHREKGSKHSKEREEEEAGVEEDDKGGRGGAMQLPHTSWRDAAAMDHGESSTPVETSKHRGTVSDGDSAGAMTRTTQRSRCEEQSYTPSSPFMSLSLFGRIRGERGCDPSHRRQTMLPLTHQPTEEEVAVTVAGVRRDAQQQGGTAPANTHSAAGERKRAAPASPFRAHTRSRRHPFLPVAPPRSSTVSSRPGLPHLAGPKKKNTVTGDGGRRGG